MWFIMHIIWVCLRMAPPNMSIGNMTSNQAQIFVVTAPTPARIKLDRQQLLLQFHMCYDVQISDKNAEDQTVHSCASLLSYVLWIRFLLKMHPKNKMLGYDAFKNLYFLGGVSSPPSYLGTPVEDHS